MKTTAILRLRLEDDRVRESLLSVLAPDNRELPGGLRLTVHGTRRGAEFLVGSDSPSTSISTVLALLRDIGLFQEVWLLSRGKGGEEHGA